MRGSTPFPGSPELSQVPVNNNRLGRDFTAQLLPRLQELRSAVAGPTPRETLSMELVEVLQTVIEELRVAEEELRSQQGQLEDAWMAAETASDWNRAMFDGAADAMLVTDAEGVVRDANEAAGTLLNLAARSMRGKPLAVFVPTEERSEFRTRLRSLADEPLPVRFDVCLQPRLAVPVAVEASVARFAPPGARAGLHWTLRDVSAARQREEGERDAGRGHLRALRAVPAAMVVLDVDGTVALWNAAAEQLLGWSEDEAAGLRAPCWGEGAEQALETALDAAAGAPVRLTMAARTRDGRELPVWVGAARLADDAGEMLRTFFRARRRNRVNPQDTADPASPDANGSDAEQQRDGEAEG